jgi:hypothetical protein
VRRLLIGAALFILACEGAATLPAPSQSAVRSEAPIDVNDMMGAFPAATFFVVTSEDVTAVALLNHATKYTIPAQGSVHIATAGGFIYLADEDKDGARVRWIDQASGTVIATRLEPRRTPFPTGNGHGAITVEPATGTVLVLYLERDGRRVVEAYEPYSLRPLGKRLESSCGDLVLAALARVVLPCFAQGTLVIKDGAGETRVVDAGLGPLTAAAMSADGATLVGRRDGTLGRMGFPTTAIEKIDPFRPAALVPDGIASPEPGRFVVALSTDDREIGVSETRSSQRYISFPSQQAPRGGILAQGQFAFWVTAQREARHIDLTQGFHETMRAFTGSRVLPGGVGQ